MASARGGVGTRFFAWFAGASLFALHLFVWPDPGRLFFGWLPGELAYRLVWMGLAWAYLLWFCARVWSEDD